eukprot:TRINITY_DN5136_c0_g1_i1.p1 TRINITY_DN5136_c0_g1~~TRINITY_DN5136_c0_g1_i1.p1  ORF type:complete len:155 (+),score=31.50 TRINITY_DN5136_c0_g1_i1:74-538(+)
MEAIDQDVALGFLRSLLIDLQENEDGMRKDFEDASLSIAEIRKRLKIWQGKHSEMVQRNMRDALKAKLGRDPPTTVSFKDFFSKIVEEFQTETEIIELIKSVNGSILKVKDMIKSQLKKDPNLYDLSSVSYTHLRAHETPEHLVCRLLLEKKKL